MQKLEMALQRAKTETIPSVDFSGDWKNELDSIMRLRQVGHALGGEYFSAVSAEHGTAIGELKGFVKGDLISLTVYWHKEQAITAWVGQCVPKSSNRIISTLWQMTNQVFEGDEWASINAGADTFKKL
jgi:hypothetical protein